jgi:TolA-binding protein
MLSKRNLYLLFLLSQSLNLYASQAPIRIETLSQDGASASLVSDEPIETILSEEPEPPQSMGEMQYQMQLLQQEIMALRGLVEQLSYEVQRHRGVQDDRYLELDRRLQSLVVQGPAIAEENQVALASENAETEGSDTLSEQALYDAGLASIKSRQFDEAIVQLKQLIERYPAGDFTANAYYWIGEVHAAKPEPDYESARQALVQVIDGFPSSNKLPDASFKLGKV